MNMPDEGYIKYQQIWEQKALPFFQEVSGLINLRDQLYKRNWIGQYPDGIGFGNVSCRIEDGTSFLITATQTGHATHLQPGQLSLVTDAILDENCLWCTGLLPASSEAISHAAIYQVRPDIQCVIHIHDAHLWQRLIGIAPTVEKETAYGTPEMGYALQELVIDDDACNNIIIAAGHTDGIFAYGPSMDAALAVLLNWSDSNK
jgi:L-ribulose-5-phosphate 4-epimerase